MQAVYPFYRPFANFGDFIAYELIYFPFFIAIEFIFRGYLLFGLAGVKDDEVQVRTEQGVAGRSGCATWSRARPARTRPARRVLLRPLRPPDPDALLYGLAPGQAPAGAVGHADLGLGAGAVAYTARSIWPVTFLSLAAQRFHGRADRGHVLAAPRASGPSRQPEKHLTAEDAEDAERKKESLVSYPWWRVFDNSFFSTSFLGVPGVLAVRLAVRFAFTPPIHWYNGINGL